MEKDTEKTNVIFYYDKGSKDVFAYFPDMVEGWKTRLSYAHIGQHSQCSIEYVKRLKKATKTDYIGLYNELESIGYNLNILK